MDKDNTKGKQAADGDNADAPRLSFYSTVMDDIEQMDFDAISGADGIDDEIALLRLKLRTTLAKDPENIKLLVTAGNSLAYLLRTRYNISDKHKKGFKEGTLNVIRDILVPLGINISTEAVKRIIQ